MKTCKIFFLSLLLGLIPSMVFSATYEVTIDENGFNPSALTINKGDTVRWVNKGTSSHSATSGFSGKITGTFDSGLLNPGSRFDHTFALPGFVYYFDKANVSHNGTVATNGVTISPGSSILLTSQSFDLVIFEGVNQPVNKITIILDGTVIYDNSELLTLPFMSTPTLSINLTEEPSARAIKIPVMPYTLSPGVHTLTIEIYSPTGLIVTDTVIYTVIGLSHDVPA